MHSVSMISDVPPALVLLWAELAARGPRARWPLSCVSQGHCDPGSAAAVVLVVVVVRRVIVASGDRGSIGGGRGLASSGRFSRSSLELLRVTPRSQAPRSRFCHPEAWLPVRVRALPVGLVSIPALSTVTFSYRS